MAMPDTALRPHALSAVEIQRETLARDLQNKEAHLRTLHSELKSTTGDDKNRLLWMIRDQQISVDQARTNLERFENPVVIPRLQLDGLTIKFHRNNQQFDVTVWVKNVSILPSLGSFELDLSVTYVGDYSQSPPLTINATFPSTTPDSTDIQPGGRNPFVFPDIPFVAAPGAASALYTFDVFLYAGPDGVVANQNLHTQMYLKPPRISLPIPIGALPIL